MNKFPIEWKGKYMRFFMVQIFEVLLVLDLVGDQLIYIIAYEL